MVGVDVETRAAGLLLKKELDYFSKVLEKPERPLTVILGGAKVADKIQLIHNMIDIADQIIIGGGMAFTFNKVLNNTHIGDSLFDEEGAKIVPAIMKKAAEQNVKIHLPTDFVVADKFAENANWFDKTEGEGIPEGMLGLDIGKETQNRFADVILNSKTLFWNGPMGVFEYPNFAHGSNRVLSELVKATQGGAISVAGGGDTLNLLKKNPDSKAALSHVSTGGGASLELVEGKQLPGIVSLSDIL